MNTCNHDQLILLPEPVKRMRCRHCHLTIKADELGSGYCPECYEASGVKRDDFEEIKASKAGITRYQCEACGTIIEYAPRNG